MAITATVTLKGPQGETVFTKTGLVNGTTNTYFIDANNYPLQIPMSGAGYTIDSAITGGFPVGNPAIGVYLLIESDS